MYVYKLLYNYLRAWHTSCLLTNGQRWFTALKSWPARWWNPPSSSTRTCLLRCFPRPPRASRAMAGTVELSPVSPPNKCWENGQNWRIWLGMLGQPERMSTRFTRCSGWKGCAALMAFGWCWCLLETSTSFGHSPGHYTFNLRDLAKANGVWLAFQPPLSSLCTMSLFSLFVFHLSLSEGFNSAVARVASASYAHHYNVIKPKWLHRQCWISTTLGAGALVLPGPFGHLPLPKEIDGTSRWLGKAAPWNFELAKLTWLLEGAFSNNRLIELDVGTEIIVHCFSPFYPYHWHCSRSPSYTAWYPRCSCWPCLQVLGTWSPSCLLWSLGDQRGPASWRNPDPREHSCYMENSPYTSIYFESSMLYPFRDSMIMYDCKIWLVRFPTVLLNSQRVAMIGAMIGNCSQLVESSQLPGSGSRRRSVRFWRPEVERTGVMLISGEYYYRKTRQFHQNYQLTGGGKVGGDCRKVTLPHCQENFKKDWKSLVKARSSADAV